MANWHQTGKKIDWTDPDSYVVRQAIVDGEIVRLRAALQRIVDENKELHCNFCEAVEIAEEALKD